MNLVVEICLPFEVEPDLCKCFFPPFYYADETFDELLFRSNIVIYLVMGIEISIAVCVDRFL